MRKDASLKRRLAEVAALQALKATASQAELSDTRAARSDAEAAFAASNHALDAGVLALDALQASDALDFDRWRIGRAVVDDLDAARDRALDTMSRRENDEADAQAVFGLERAREDLAQTLHRKLARSVDDKRDDAAVLEAGALTSVRKLMRPA